MSFPAHPLVDAARNARLVRPSGRVVECQGLLLEAQGPDAALGEICDVQPRGAGGAIPAEVVGFRHGRVLLMPYGRLQSVGPGSAVVARGQSWRIPVGHEFLGRVVGSMGFPLDGKPAPRAAALVPLRREPLNPLSRPPINTVLETGVRAIDALLTLGRGQRIGIFAGAGVGKTTLLGMLARQIRADVIVLAMVGERGREVREFIEHNLGVAGLARTVVVVSTSEQAALLRCNAAWAATAMAEWFRDQGAQVALIMDSLSRFAMAMREVGLATGEPSTARGYTPSVFASLPLLLERCGTVPGGGSISAFYTVLVDGDDLAGDPVADAVRAVLDGHLVLSRELAERLHFPAIDIGKSISRLASTLASKDERALVQRAVGMLHRLTRSRDLVELGAYKPGSDPELDLALQLAPRLDDFLRQGLDEATPRARALQLLAATLKPQ